MSTVIEAYDPDWPVDFEQICKALDSQLHHIEGVSYDHIGSTSVPSLCARPVIDILITAPGPQVEGLRNELMSCGRYDNCTLVDTRLDFISLRARDESPRPHTVFICAHRSLLARAHLAVRDVLRSDRELRDKYATTKTRALKSAKQQYTKETYPDRERYLSAYAQKKNGPLQELIIASHRFTSHELALLFASDPTARWESISTPRLLLREYEMSDVDGMFALEGNVESARYQDWHPWTYLQARQNILRGIQGSYVKGRTVVELSVVHESAFIGRIGGRITRLAEPPAENLDDQLKNEVGPKRMVEHIDLWYSFLPSGQGKGLATEAMQSFIAALLKKEKVESTPLELEIECDPRNTGSWKMAERLGFVKISLTERAWESKGEWVDSLVYQKVV